MDSAVGTLVGMAKNRGHIRLYLLASGLWVSVALYAVWGPLPCASVYDVAMGATVLGCENTVLDYAQDVELADAMENLRVLLWRGLIVISAPVFLPLLLLLVARIYDWVRAGYRTPS